MNDDENETIEEFGEIVKILIKEGCLTLKHAKYAQRVQSKLEVSRPLVKVIKQLDYASDDDIKKAIRSHKITMGIGRLLAELGYISESELQKAINIQKEKKDGKKLGEILIERNILDERTYLDALSLKLGCPLIEPEFADLDRSLFSQVPAKWYDSHKFIPVRMEKGKILIAFADPTDSQTLSSVQQIFGEEILPGIASVESIKKAIVRVRSYESEKHVSVGKDSIVGVVNSIIIAATKENASDIHIEPLKEKLRIRFRRDGVLGLYKEYPLKIIPTLTNRLKVMCEADIVEKRRHQGGRLFFSHRGEELDCRVSFYVTVHGEKIVMRLLNRQGSLRNLEDIGMSKRFLDRFINDALLLPSGVVMVTGPTGSGKTTTVYSCINFLNHPGTSIITAEEPVEYIIDGISQCSINPRINLTFDETLRHIVRQDPDIIVIGEIRDKFSAEVAVQSALTGHKVLTTFHTEDSIGGLIRLLNMEIEAFLISSTVVSVIAQRLLRRVCPNCAAPYQPSPGEIQRLGYSPKDLLGGKFKKGKGCSQCRHSGYMGRVGIFELLILDELIRDALLCRKTSHEIRNIGIESSGLITLIEDGIYKAASGETTLEEVLRCLPRTNKPRPLGKIRRLLGG